MEDLKTVEVEAKDGQKPVAPSDGYLEAAAALNKAVEAMASGVKDLAEIRRLQHDMSVEAAKFRPAGASQGGDFLAKSMDDAISSPHRNNAELKQLQELNDRALMKAIIHARNSGIDIPKTAKGEYLLGALPKDAFVSEEARQLQNFVATKAAGSFWDTGTPSGGSEWTPTGFSSMVVDFHTIDNDIPSLFQQVDIPMNVGPFSMSVDATRATAVIWDEKTAASGSFVDTAIFSQAQSAVMTFNPQKHANGHAVSVEGNEDLAFNALQRAVAGSQNAVRWGVTEAIINAQTASDSDLDDAPATSGLTAADGYDVAGNGDNGLRLHCVQNSYTEDIGGAGNELEATDVFAMRKAMGNFGARSNELVLICSPAAYLSLIQDTNVLQVQNYGSRATILTGELASVGGIPVIMTSEFPEALDASGINNNPGTNSFTGAILANRTRWYFASKRALTTTLLPQPGQDIINVISTARTHFHIAVTDEHSAEYAINIPTS